MFEEHGFDNPCPIISKYLGWELKVPLCLVLMIRVSQDFFKFFFYIFIFYIVSFFEDTSLPRLVDRGFAGIFLDALASLNTMLDIK